MIRKSFVSASSLFHDSFRLAGRIYDSGFRPDVVLVMWRGGTPVGIVVHEFLCFKGIKPYHAVVKAESYRGIGKRVAPKIENLGFVLKKVKKNDRVLVVDDIFDTGETLRKVCRALKRKTDNIRTATLYFKDRKTPRAIMPDFVIRRVTNWIVFPHELVGLSSAEIKIKSRFVHQLLAEK